MSAALVDGWLVVPFANGTDAAVAEIQVGDGVWTPAFHDFDSAGARVAKIRPPADVPDGAPIRSRVNGGPATNHGRYRR